MIVIKLINNKMKKVFSKVVKNLSLLSSILILNKTIQLKIEANS